jgi:cytochrome c-type biogenesis protein CcmH
MIKLRKFGGVLAAAVVALSFGLQIRVAAQQLSDREKQVGGKFMCMCGCNQVLTQCNHVGCSTSANMLKELHQAIARGDSETAVTQMFVQEFGTKVYAEPPKSGLSMVAWMLPSVYLVLGTVLVIFVIMRWRARPVRQTAVEGIPSGVSHEELDRVRQRVARDTED